MPNAMEIQTILSDLRQHRDQIQAAIDALEQLSGGRRGPGRPKGRRRVMSADARRRIGLAMKKRWAARKSA